MKRDKSPMSQRFDRRGDTIIEVLIAIAIAAFAIGISYATAQRSLQQAISSREHNQALNIIESQLADLQLRYQHTDTNFESQFGNSNPQHHYCLNDDSTSSSDTTNQWAPYFNGSSAGVGSTLATPPYDAKCVQGFGGASYYIDIATSASTASKSPTLYHITVRWAKVGGGTNQSGIYYKLDGSQAATLGAVTNGAQGLQSLSTAISYANPELYSAASSSPSHKLTS